MGARLLGFSLQSAHTSVWVPLVEETGSDIYRTNPALVNGDDLKPDAPLTDPWTDVALARGYDELTGYPAPSTSRDATKSVWPDGGVLWLAGCCSP